MLLLCCTPGGARVCFLSTLPLRPIASAPHLDFCQASDPMRQWCGQMPCSLRTRSREGISLVCRGGRARIAAAFSMPARPCACTRRISMKVKVRASTPRTALAKPCWLALSFYDSVSSHSHSAAVCRGRVLLDDATELIRRARSQCCLSHVAVAVHR